MQQIAVIIQCRDSISIRSRADRNLSGHASRETEDEHEPSQLVHSIRRIAFFEARWEGI